MNKKLFSAALLLSFLSILSRGLGFVREVIFASAFGLNYDFDIYLVGAVIPLLINTAVSYLAQNYFIPEYHLKKQNSSVLAIAFFKSVCTLFGITSLVFTAVLFLSSSSIIDLYLGPVHSAVSLQTLQIFRVFILTIPLNSVFSVLASLEQSEKEFLPPALSPLFLNTFVIVCVLLFNDSLGIFTIPLGNLAGYVLQYIYMVYVVRKRFGLKTIFARFRFSDIKQSLSIPLAFIVLIEIISQLNQLIDRCFFPYVDTGGLSSMNYAATLYSLPITIFSFAASTVIFPEFSRYFSASRNKELENSFTRILQILTILFVPVFYLFYFYGDFFVKILFERGQFSASGTEMTFQVLKMLSVSLVFYSAYSVINKLLYSAGLLRQLLVLSVLVAIVKVIASIALVGYFKQNGLAMATSSAYIILSFCGYWLAKRKLNFTNQMPLIKTGIYYFAAGFILIYIIKIIMDMIPGGIFEKQMISIVLFSLMYLLLFLLTEKIKKTAHKMRRSE